MKTLLWFVLLFAVACSEGPDIVAEEETDMSIKRITPFYDDFDARAASEQRKKASAVPVVEPRNGPWSGSPYLGQSQLYLPSANNRQTIIKMPEWGAPRVRTVTLGLNYNVDVTDATDFSVSAEVVAGAGGSANTFSIDWENGVTFSVPCNSLEVSAIYTDVGGAFSVPDDLLLTAVIGDGGILHAAPTKTILSEVIVSGATTALIPIPRYAKKVRLLPARGYPLASLVNAANNFVMYLGAGNTAGIYPGDKTDYVIEGIRIPNGARMCRFTNNSGVTFEFFYQFELNL